MLRYAALLSLLAVACSVRGPESKREPVGGKSKEPGPNATEQTPVTQGVITGNGSGGVPDRERTELPHASEITKQMDRLAKAEPTFVRLVRNFVLTGQDAPQLYRTVPKDRAKPKADHADEACFLEKKEVRAYFDEAANNITFCRGFFYTKASEYKEESKPSFRMAVMMHEFLHVLFAVRKVEFGHGEEEIVSSFDSLFLDVVDAGAGNAEFRAAVLALRDHLDRHFQTLGLESLPDEVVGPYASVPLLESGNPDLVFPLPLGFHDAEYIAPHFLDYQLGALWTKTFPQAVAGLLTAKLGEVPVIRDADLGDGRQLAYYQVLYRMKEQEPEFKMVRTSLAQLNSQVGFEPNSNLEPRVLSKVALSPEMRTFLARAAGPDMGAFWLRTIEYRPADGSASHSTDYLFFAKD